MATSPVTGNPDPAEEPNRVRIIVQGGVYRNLPIDMKEEYLRATKQAAKEGYSILQQEDGTAVDAVEVAVRVFESNELFNCGRGSLLNNDCKVECDAMIMEGEGLKNGAVISGKHFLHPISLAKKIMTKSDHCALSGEGALNFARRQHFPIYDPEELICQQAKDRVKVSYEEYLNYVKYYYGGGPVTETNENGNARTAGTDSVSAVAMDSKGILACATSSGGIAGKLEGRVGDVPLIGCGGYASKEGSVTCAGDGESIMKMTLARQVVYNMKNGLNAQESVASALTEMKTRVKGHGGIIAIDKNGNFGKDFNTPLMVWASIEGSTLTSGMEIDKEPTVEPLVPASCRENAGN